jgi:hypothetical protein
MARLVALADVAVQGTLVETFVRCGKPSCGCREDPTRRHGPHTYLKFRAADGRATSIYVPQTHVAEIRRAVDAWTALWEMSVALSERNRESVRTRVRQRRRGARGA